MGEQRTIVEMFFLFLRAVNRLQSSGLLENVSETMQPRSSSNPTIFNNMKNKFSSMDSPFYPGKVRYCGADAVELHNEGKSPFAAVRINYSTTSNIKLFGMLSIHFFKYK